MKRVFAITTVILSLAGVVLAGCSKPASAASPTPGASSKSAGPPPQKFIFNECTFQSMYTSPWVKFYLNKITENSGGKMTFDIYWAESLGYKNAAYLQVSRDGLAPFSDTMTSFVASDLAELQIGENPMLAHMPHEFEKVRQKIEPLLRKVLDEKWKSTLLANYPMAPQALWTKKPVRSLKDLKGLKVRVLSGPTAEWATALGMVPVTVPFPEVYTALSRGTIDAVITSSSGVWTQKFYEVVKYQPVAGVVTYLWFNMANKDVWNKLDPVYRKAVNDAQKPALDFVLKDLATGYQSDMENLKKVGADFTLLPQADIDEMTRLAKPIWEKWGNNNGPIAKQAMDAARQAVGK